MERICAHCGLEMATRMVTAANEWVKSDRQDKWRRFEPRDLARILPEISDEMERHGYETPPEIARFRSTKPSMTNIITAPAR
jgi:hypothetical protein